MEKKNRSVAWWEILLLCLGITTFVVGITWAILFFTKSDKRQGNTTYEQERITHYFPNPDRLVIKEADRNEYYIVTKQEKEYVSIVELLDEAIDNAKPAGESIVEQIELDNMEQSGDFLMLDYNRISKNYILDCNKKKLIRYKEEGGVTVRKDMDLTKLNKKIKEVLEGRETYPLEGRILVSQPQTIENLAVNADGQLGDKKLENKGDGIYQLKLTSIQELQDMEKLLGVNVISQNQNITEELMKDHFIILTITNHPIVSVQASLRKIEYEYFYDTKPNYEVQCFLVSKAVNSDCIYNTFSTSGRVEKQNGFQADGTYYTNEYLPNYRIYSDYEISEEKASSLGFTKQQDNVYTIPIKTEEQLDDLNDRLKLYGFNMDGGEYDDIRIENNNYQYFLCVKNTTGHFEVSVENRYDYVKGTSFDMTNLVLETAEITDDTAKTKLQGNVIAIPKAVSYQKIVIKSKGEYADTFVYNTRKFSADEVKRKVKEKIRIDDDAQAFLDILSEQTPFGSYFVVPNDSFRRIWVVITEEDGMPAAVAVDATTGEILASNELGC